MNIDGKTRAGFLLSNAVDITVTKMKHPCTPFGPIVNFAFSMHAQGQSLKRNGLPN